MASAFPSPLHDPSIPVLDHSEAVALLPWLPTDGLQADERRQVLVHLESCSECRRELLYLSELRAVLDMNSASSRAAQADGLIDVEESFASVMRRIDDGHGTESHGAPPEGPARFSPRPENGFSRIGGWPLAASLTFLMLGAAWVFMQSSPPLNPSAQGTFTTLSDGASPAESAAPDPSGIGLAKLSIGFQPNTSVERMSQLVRSINGEMIAGPSNLGIFTIALRKPASENAAPDRLQRVALERLRAEPEVSFAEPKR